MQMVFSPLMQSLVAASFWASAARLSLRLGLLLFAMAGAVGAWAVVPSIYNLPPFVAVDAGQTLTLSPAIAGTSPITYQWKKNGTDINGATNATFSKSSVSTADAGDYTLVATNASGSTTSNVVTVQVNAPQPPVLYPSSTDVSCDYGTTLSLSMSVAGTTPMTFQWKKNGVDIPDATSSSYWKNMVTTSDAGVYTLVATNSAGSATSSGITVTVASAVPPEIYEVPLNRVAERGSSFSLSASVSGSQPISYRWQKNSVDIPDATDRSYYKSNVTDADAGTYTLVATNVAGSATSSGIPVTVLAPQPPSAPVITFYSTPSTVAYGNSISISASITGTQPMTFQWYRDGVALSGRTSSSLYISSAKTTDSGTYTLRATNSVGTTTSAAVVVTVQAPVGPTVSPLTAAVSLSYGNALSLSASASGSPSLRYQWTKNGNFIPGANSSSYYRGPVTEADAGSYAVIVVNDWGSATSTPAVVTVNQPTAPTIQLNGSANLNVAFGSYFSISPSVSGTAPMTYEWRRNGVTLFDATGSSMSRSGVTGADAGTYTLVVTNAWGSVTSPEITVTVAAPVAPQISGLPATLSVSSGSSFNFSANISGTSPMTLQWNRNGVPIPGATSNYYGKSQASVADSGAYTLTVTNAAGSTTSSASTVTVSAPIAPVITGLSAGTTVSYGSYVSISPNVTGTSPMTLQWSKNGVAIPGANSSSYYLSSATPADNGTYTLAVTNEAGSTTSSGFQLTVLPGQPPAIYNLPSTLTVSQGNSFSFYPTILGTSPMSYQWRRDGVAIIGATSSSFSKSNLQPADSGAYSLVVTNAWGTVTSRDIAVTVTPSIAPAIFNVPATRVANYGDSLTLSPSVIGTGPLSYQWSKDGTPIPGANSQALGFSPATPAANGVYALTVSNAVGSVTSTGINLLVNPAVPPAVLNLPTELNLSYGSSISLSATVVGSQPMSYVWRKDGVPLGSTGSSYSKYSSITPADSGSYTLTVTNVAGTATATVAITVAPPAAPTISGLPATLSVVYGSSIYLSPNVSGSSPIRYQWRKNGVDIPGANSSSLSLSAATPANSGSYTLFAANVAGSATSSTVAVTVADAVPVTFIEQPQSLAIQAGLTANFSVQTAGTSPVTYQWYRNGTAIIGATSNSLSVPDVQSATLGDYTVVAQNPTGQVTSNVARLTLDVPVGVLSVAAGSGHTAILKADGTLWTVGDNYYGQLGDGSFRNRWNPRQVATNVISVAAGSASTYFLKDDGTLWGMGLNNSGQLGDGTTQTRALPFKIASEVVTVAAGFSHALFVKRDGSLWGMGSNVYGQLGNGTQGTSLTTAFKIVSSGVRAVIAGSVHSAFITESGELWAMGYNGSGQLGVGDTNNRLVPVAVATNVVTAAAGSSHTLFVKGDGSLWATGANGYGQLGDGSTTTRLSPVSIASGVESVTAGGQFSAYVKTDGSLWSMGYNSYGQLGDGSWTSRAAPTSIASDIALAVAREGNLFAISTSGALLGTGENYNGSLGDGTATSRNVLLLLSAAPAELSPRALPAEQAVASGGFVRLSVFGAGGATYQWYRNGVALAGATLRTLTLGNVQPGDAGEYSVTVTRPNTAVVTLRSWVGVRSNRTAHTDLDRDGAPDLVLENGLTGERVIWRMRGGAIAGSVQLPTFTSGWHFAGTGDFNRDGNADLVLQNTQTAERVIWLMSGGTILGSAGLPTLPLTWQFACVGDINNDGSADIVLQTTNTGDRVVWLMNGVSIAGSLGLPTIAPEWQICAMIDIDSDGQNDLVLQNVRTGERKVWVLALQSGQLSVNRTIQLPTFYAGWRFAGAGFFTMDGKPNLLLQNSLSGERVLWSMGTDGAIVGSTAVPTLSVEWSFAGAATNRAPISGLHDLNGDGSSDILVTNTVAGDRVIWAMQNGAIAGSIGLPTLPADWRFAGLGDFNADGLNDILLENTSTGDRVLWLMNNGTIGGGAGLPTLAPAWRFAAVVDVNLDGQPDIVLQNTTTGERAIWVMDRTKVDSTIALPTLPLDWNIAGAGKFTADGRANLILENTSTGDRLFWSLNPDGAIAQSIGLPTLPVSWHIAGTGDFNTDGQPDILLENTSSGDRVIWAMDHTNIASSIGLPTLPTSWILRD